MDHSVMPLPLVQSRITKSRANPGTPIRTPRLSVVVVNYHQWEYTGQLVRRLCSSAAVRDGRAEVVVIDNDASSWREA